MSLKIEKIVSKETNTNEPVKFDVFYESLKSIVDSNKTNAVGESFGLIEKGFSDESNKEWVDKTLELLNNWVAIDNLAVKLTVEKYSEKLKSSFAVQISNRLRMHFREKLKYPLPVDSKSVSIDEVFYWLNQTAKLEQPAEFNKENDVCEKSSNYPLSDNILRMKFVCLFGELNDNDLCKAIDVLLETYIKSTDKNYEPTRNSYIKSVGILLSQKLSTLGIKNILVSSSVLKKDVSDIQHSENTLRQNLRNLENRLKNSEIKESALQNQLVNANAEIGKLKADMKKNESQLKELSERYEASKIHWQKSLKQDLDSQSAHIRDNVTHQIDQLRLCLDDKSPDIETALIFVQRIQKIVGGADGKN